ncbi:MAG: MarR family transcriptional regulator [Spirochaetaceae bacterium]|jgi:DNA-binding MarR family transcriptional regulator|nr:MarR family transcriptional regulator [Spirochaetaceae bacterium]
MIPVDENLSSIFELEWILKYAFFKNFEATYDFPDGINPTHIKTIMMIKFRGASRMSELSHLANLEKGSFTPVAKSLIKLGYIERFADKEDKRASRIKLTPRGDQFADSFAKAHRLYLSEKLERMSDVERTEYFAAIQLIRSQTLKFMDIDSSGHKTNHN